MNSGVGIVNLGAGIMNSGAGIVNLDSELTIAVLSLVYSKSRSGTKSQFSIRSRNSELRFCPRSALRVYQGQNCNCQFGVRIHNSGSGIQNSGSRIHNSDSRIHNSDSRIHNSDSRIHYSDAGSCLFRPPNHLY